MLVKWLRGGFSTQMGGYSELGSYFYGECETWSLIKSKLAGEMSYLNIHEVLMNFTRIYTSNSLSGMLDISHGML